MMIAIAFERFTARRLTGQAVSLRARMLLRCAECLSNTAVAAELLVTEATFGKWRTRFVSNGIAGLLDDPRGGAPREITGEQVQRVSAKTLEAPPASASHRSTRAAAAASGLSCPPPQRTWRVLGLQPHRTETLRPSTDPSSMDNARDIVRLYLDPPKRTLLLCADEKTQSQASGRTHPILPMRPGIPERLPHDYRRHGTTTLITVLDVASGTGLGTLHRRHRSVECRAFLHKIGDAEAVPCPCCRVQRAVLTCRTW
jgi:hypothetical protein